MMLNTKNKILISTAFIFIILLTSTTPLVQAKKNILTVPGDYPTIRAAIDAANPGDIIKVGPGEWVGAIVNKPVTILGRPGATIVDGEYEYWPGGGSMIGFFITPEGVGSTISSFTFKGGPIVDTGKVLHFAIFARGTDSITFTRNIILDCVQCITNNGGDNWVITFNYIRASGTAIFMPSSSGTINGNLIAFNSIESNSLDGILVSAKGVNEATKNRIIANKICGPSVTGISLLNCIPSVFYSNTIALNDLRGCTIALEIPPGIVEVNTVWKNLI